MTRSPSIPYDLEARTPWMQLPFSAPEYQRRVASVHAAMRAQDLDLVLIFGAPTQDGSVRWLTNFWAMYGQSLVALPADDEPFLYSNWVMHSEPMHSLYWQTWVRDVHPASSSGPLVRVGAGPMTKTVEHLGTRFGGHGTRVGIDGWHNLPHGWLDALRTAWPHAHVEPFDDTMLLLRALKSDEEVTVMRRAASVAGAAMRSAMDSCVPGASEHQVAAAAYRTMFEAGVEDRAFPIAVVSGPRTGLKHCPPTDRVLEVGDMVFLDLGACVSGYFSDLSRCLVIGEPSDLQRAMLETAERMFGAWLGAATSGSRVDDLRALSAEIAIAAGFEREYVPDGFGHGLGASMRELPSLGPSDDQVLASGMVFALEPMLVKLGVGTAVVEDTVLVTDDGLEVLSDLPVRVYS